MIDPAGKSAARQTMGEAVPESDIDRLLNAARTSALEPHNDFPHPTGGQGGGQGVEQGGGHGGGHDAVLTNRVDTPAVTMWDIPIFILYACLGVFTRIWTDITLQFDFGTDNGLRVFAFAVLVALHGVILSIVFSAWRAKWVVRARNLTAIAALAGYLGCRLITQL